MPRGSRTEGPLRPDMIHPAGTQASHKRILYFPNRKKSGERMIETPLRCRMPKIPKPSRRYSQVPSVTRNPSAKTKMAW